MKHKFCTLDGCHEKHLGKGFCRKHYNDWYREVNREKIAAHKRADYAANRKERIAKQRRHYQETREYRLEWQRQYRKDNPDICARAASNWRKANPEYGRAKIARRRRQGADGMNSLDRYLSVEWRKFIKSDPCHYCGERAEEMHDDHMIPLARGGTDHWQNLVRACASCNLSKHTKTAEKFISELKSGSPGK